MWNPTASWQDHLQSIWESLTRATSDAKHPWRYPALATASEGSVRQRTVVLRKVSRNPSVVWAYTDLRTQKVADLRANPGASWLFYHPKQRVQLLLSTRVQLHHQDPVSREHWAALTPTQRKEYQSEPAPGFPEPVTKEAEENLTDQHFCVLEAALVQLELLILDQEEHVRCRFTHDGKSWQGQRLVP